MYTKEEEIIHFLFVAFNGLKRKKEDIDMVFHSIMVGIMLKNVSCDEDTVYIGYLHDVIEDTKYTYDDLLNKYGKKIADGVRILSEDQSIKDYAERKANFVSQLKNADKNVLLVEVAGKLQNLVSDYDLYLKNGKNALITEADSYENFKNYYLELQKIFNEKISSNVLLDRFNELVKEYFCEE